MLGIRQKLSLGFGGLLAIIVVIGFQSVSLISELGSSIDVILRENYRSVIACQEMKEALERIDSGALFRLFGYGRERPDQTAESVVRFEKSLDVELNNITIPGEEEKAKLLQALFKQYKTALAVIKDPNVPNEVKRETYFTRLLPLFERIRATADDILQMNQNNMGDANDRARQTATAARQRMVLLLLVVALVATAFMYFTGKWILRPIARLIASADEIRSGNLDLVVRADSRDEIGALSEAFNGMAASLRELRRTDRAKLIRIQRSIEQAFKFLPDAVAIVDPEGNIEVASGTAASVFDLRPNENVTRFSFPGVAELFHKALRTGQVAEARNGHSLIQRFIRGEERYFRAKAVPILDADRQPTGVIVILSDATQERQQNELKKGVISTVAHQLKTPLTSVRMALHLLLDERMGPLTEKQAELLIAAREESERLHSILGELLEISRIESGKAQMDCRPISPHQLVFESVDPFRRAAQDKGITLETALPDELPEVVADPLLIGQVFANLLSNSLKYTAAGGKVSVSAQTTDDAMVFEVSDSGIGIPSQYRDQILEQFFRVPGQEAESGAGLGLSIVQEIVGAHGGIVQVESTEGVGSTFSFSLRRADAHTEEEPNHD